MSPGVFHRVPFVAHLNAAGHELMAEVLEEALAAHGLLPTQARR